MLCDKIKSLRLSLGMNQSAFAKRLFVTPGAVSQWEKGITRPDTDRLMAIAKEFSVPLDYFAEESDIKIIPGAIPIVHKAVPILGTIAASPQTEPETGIEGYADLPNGVKADFALRCKGKSMETTFMDGDLVLIRQQPEVENGQIAAVGIDGETTLKRVYVLPDGLHLRADNPSFSPIYVPQDSGKEIIIHGLAVGYTRMFD